MFRKLLLTMFVVAGALIVASPIARAGSSDLWIHIIVNEADADGDHVEVNMPLKMAEAMVPMLEDEAEGHHGHLHFDHHDLDAEKLRAFWKAAKETGDGEFVSVKSRDDAEVVNVARQGEHLLINVDDEDATVRVRIPVTVVDALLGGENDELDLVAAVRALRSHGESDLVSIEDGESSVHIWVDSNRDSDDEQEKKTK